MPAKKNSHTKRSRSEEAYERFVRRLRLFALGLDRCSANINRAAYFGVLEKQGASRRVSAEYSLLNSRGDFFNAQAKFKLVVSHKTTSESPLSIECAFSAHFHVHEKKTDPDFAKRFVDTEFRVIVWPYFRQFISDTTARMTIPPIVIPFSSLEE